MVAILGWLNVILIIVLAQIYTLKKIMIAASATRSKATASLVSWHIVYKFWRTVHPFMGLATLVIGSYHGYLALGALRLHTGSLVLTNLFLSAIVGGLLLKSTSSKKRLRFIHRALALLLVATFLTHYFWPILIPFSL